MNKKSRVIIDEMLESGMISSEQDLTGNSKTSLLFDFMLNKYGYLLEDNVEEEKQIINKKLFHTILTTVGKYFLKNPQVFEENSNKLVYDEPVIYLVNHRFKDDVLASLLSVKDETTVFFGSVPLFYGTIDGALLSQNGVVLVNRKVSSSRKSSVDKAKKVLEENNNLLMFPEGVWNKSPNKLLLDFFGGFYRIAQKEDGTFYKVVPIVHYIGDTNNRSRKNKIHTFVDQPIDLSNMSEEEAITFVRDRMATIYYGMMEKYGTTTRDKLLKGYSSSQEAWEAELKRRVATAAKYDFDIETSADKRDKNSPLVVWEPIANLEVTKENAAHVAYAKQKVKELKLNDFQHRF